MIPKKNKNRKNSNVLKADALHIEANYIINDLGLGEILSKYCKKIFYTGSYYLNTLAWGDLDISVILNSNFFSMNDFMCITKEIGLIEGIQKINYRNYLKEDPRPIPIGLYNGIYLDIGSKIWKIDLWAVDETKIENDKKEMKRILDKIDSKKRELILEVKNKILTKSGRTPPFSGFHIYKCVVDRNMKNSSEIIEYMREKLFI